MPQSNTPPDVVVDEAMLTNAGFVNSGIVRYRTILTDTAKEVFDRAIALGDAAKATGLDREVTHDHVMTAARAIPGHLAAQPRPWWIIPCHILEYVLAIVAGLGAGHIKEDWGVFLFGGGLAVAVLLIVARLLKQDRSRS